MDQEVGNRPMGGEERDWKKRGEESDAFAMKVEGRMLGGEEDK